MQTLLCLRASTKGFRSLDHLSRNVKVSLDLSQSGKSGPSWQTQSPGMAFASAS